MRVSETDSATIRESITIYLTRRHHDALGAKHLRRLEGASQRVNERADDRHVRDAHPQRVVPEALVVQDERHDRAEDLSAASKDVRVDGQASRQPQAKLWVRVGSDVIIDDDKVPDYAADGGREGLNDLRAELGLPLSVQLGPVCTIAGTLGRMQ